MKIWKSLLLPAFAGPQTASPAEAMALEQQGKLPEAVEAWRTVTEQNPQDARAFASLGVALARETEYKEAAAAYHRAIALKSKTAGHSAEPGAGRV
jgi:Flp pilus assembly protein TadD